MNVERIKAMLDERPFRAFDIHRSDGKVVTVNSPDFAWVHPFGSTMYVCPDPAVDADQVINLLHITKLSKPGQHRRRGRGK